MGQPQQTMKGEPKGKDHLVPALQAQQTTPSGKGLTWTVVAVLLLGWIPGQLPDTLRLCLTLPAAVAGLGYLGYKLLKFHRWHHEHPHLALFVPLFFAAMLELVFENCMVWMVSALDWAKYRGPKPLQDNGLVILGWFYRNIPYSMEFLRLPWCHTLQFLLALLAVPFSIIWDQVPYSGFGIMNRVFTTMIVSRLCRIACFMSTVLPSPTYACYSKRFPVVQDTTWEMWKYGLSTLRGNGGCNDLIFSGHGAFWVMAPLAYYTYGPRGWHSRACLTLLWVAIFHASLQTVLDRHHYTVDMILAVVVPWGIWNSFEWVYCPREKKLDLTGSSSQTRSMLQLQQYAKHGGLEQKNWDGTTGKHNGNGHMPDRDKQPSSNYGHMSASHANSSEDSRSLHGVLGGRDQQTQLAGPNWLALGAIACGLIAAAVAIFIAKA